MASNYTENYGLCQWEATDQVLREEFNQDNAKIDTALGEMLKIVTGTYKGTGERGSEYPNTLTFPFQPKMVLITVETKSSLALGTAMIYGQKYSGGLGVTSSSNHGLQMVLTWDENTLSWYTETSYAYYQLNQLNATYHYLAIG